MSSDNGSGTVDELERQLGIDQEQDPTVARLDRELGNVPKLRLDPSQLTIRDLKRAKIALEGRNPFELLDDPLDAITLTIWCLRSRTDLAFTFEQAEDTPLDELDMVGEDAPPPPAAAPTPTGSGRGEPAKPSSKPRRRSAGSTASP